MFLGLNGSIRAITVMENARHALSDAALPAQKAAKPKQESKQLIKQIAESAEFSSSSHPVETGSEVGPEPSASASEVLIVPTSSSPTNDESASTTTGDFHFANSFHSESDFYSGEERLSGDQHSTSGSVTEFRASIGTYNFLLRRF